MAEGVQSTLGLEARASQDVYGSGPQTFPYVGYFPEPWYGGGGGGGEDATAARRRHVFANLGAYPSDEHESVRISTGKVYCGFQNVSVGPYTASNNSAVYLNITLSRGGSFQAQMEKFAAGDVSILLYNITDSTVEDFVSGTMFLPYYN